MISGFPAQHTVGVTTVVVAFFSSHWSKLRLAFLSSPANSVRGQPRTQPTCRHTDEENEERARDLRHLRGSVLLRSSVPPTDCCNCQDLQQLTYKYIGTLFCTPTQNLNNAHVFGRWGLRLFLGKMLAALISRGLVRFYSRGSLSGRVPHGCRPSRRSLLFGAPLCRVTRCLLHTRVCPTEPAIAPCVFSRLFRMALTAHVH